jgi:hypothetical protein
MPGYDEGVRGKPLPLFCKKKLKIEKLAMINPNC